MIVGVGLQMLDHIRDAAREHRNLDVGRSGVTFVQPVLLDNRALLLRGEGHATLSHASACRYASNLSSLLLRSSIAYGPPGTRHYRASAVWLRISILGMAGSAGHLEDVKEDHAWQSRRASTGTSARA